MKFNIELPPFIGSLCTIRVYQGFGSRNSQKMRESDWSKIWEIKFSKMCWSDGVVCGCCPTVWFVCLLFPCMWVCFSRVCTMFCFVIFSFRCCTFVFVFVFAFALLLIAFSIHSHFALAFFFLVLILVLVLHLLLVLTLKHVLSG